MVNVPAGDLLTTAEAAALLGVSRRRVQLLVRAGRLPTVRVGIVYGVLRADVEAFAAIPRPQGWTKGKPRPPRASKRK